MERIAGLVDELLHLWSTEEVVSLSGVSGDEIRVFEDKFHVVIPDDMRYYLERVNGMAAKMWDGAMIAFHQLSDVVSLHEEMKEFKPEYRRVLSAIKDAENVFIFADYLISSHYYAIRLFSQPCQEDNEVMWVMDSEYATIARSYSDFLDRYLSEREAIIFPDGHA